MAKQNPKHTFDFTGILNAEINQQNWKEKKKLLQKQFGEFKMALDTDLAEAEAQKILDMFNEKLNIQLNVEQVKKDAETVKKIIETALASFNNIDTSALRGIEDILDRIATTTDDIAKKMGKGVKNAVDSGVASINKLDDEIKGLKGDLSSINDAFQFDIKDDASQQLRSLNKLQRNLNKALQEGSWLEQQKALVKYAKAYEATREKFEQDGSYDLSKFDKKYGAYQENRGRIADAKINLQNLQARGNGGELIGIDTGALATEDTLKKIANKLDNLKVNVSGDDNPSKNNSHSIQQDVTKELKGIIAQLVSDYDKLFDAWGDRKINDDEFDLKQKELINKTSNNLKVNNGFDIKQVITDALTDGDSSSELFKKLKDNVIGIKTPIKSAVTTSNQQPTSESGATVNIDEATLGNAIANALKGVQLGTEVKGEVKASIDVTELKNVLHDGTAYDVKIVGGENKDVSKIPYHATSQDDAAKYISEHYDYQTWEDWFSRAFDEARTKIAEMVMESSEFKNATLNQMWHSYKGMYGEIPFEEFLYKEVPLYRGESIEGKSVSEKAISFSLKETVANACAEGIKVLKIMMRPIDTLGVPRLSASNSHEAEVIVPKDIVANMPEYKEWKQMQHALFKENMTGEEDGKATIDGDNEPWAKETTLGEVKGILESIKANTDKFVVDNADPRAETLKKEIQTLKTKHPSDLFEAADNQKLITDKENELNNLGGKSVNYAQITTALVQIATMLTAKTIETAIGANTNAIETFTKHLNGQTGYFDGLQNLLSNIVDAFKQSNISTTIITTGDTLETLNNTLRGISKLVAIPMGAEEASQVDSEKIDVIADDVTVQPTNARVTKVKQVQDKSGKAIQEDVVSTEKTNRAVRTTTETYALNRQGELEHRFTIMVDDFDKLVREQKSEQQKIAMAQAKLREFLTSFNNKTLGQGKNISGYKDVESLLANPNDWNLDTIETAKNLMLGLNTEYNKLVQDFRRGSSSLNPFVNAINNTEKLENQIKNIQLDFATLKDAPPELELDVSDLNTDLKRAIDFKDTKDLTHYAEAYGDLRKKIVSVINEIRRLRKEQGITQQSSIFEINKDVVIAKSDAQIQEWERMFYIPDELREKFRLLHSELNNVTDKDELSIWKKQWEEISALITSTRREYNATTKKDLAETIKNERKNARINAANSSWNTGQRTIESLWKIDDDAIDPENITVVKQLDAALQNLSKTQKQVNDEINSTGESKHTEELKKQTQAVAALTAKVKELVSNYERFSGDNATKIGSFATGDNWEEQITTTIKSQYPGAKIKSINHDLQEVTYELKSGTRAFTEYTAGVRKADKQIVALKGTTKKLPTFLEGVKRKLGEISQYFSAMSLINRAMQELRKGLQYVKEIDLALTELKKVTDETEATYDKFLDTAAKTGARLGTPISAVIEATATFAKLGYTMKQASEMAEAAIVYKNVGDGIASTEDAADSIISTLKGFGMEASETMRIVDRFNEVGNRFAITSKGIGEALRLSASALNEGGNSLDESIALITAANEVVNDPSSVGKK